MRVKLDSNNPACRDYPDLTPGNTYRVIGIEADALRIMNDQGLPYLYPAELFEIVDTTEPPDWQTEYGAEGERYSYPPELRPPGFFEDYFEGDRQAVARLRRYLAEKWR